MDDALPTDPDARLRLDDQLCFALHTASAAVVRAYRPLLLELGLTYQQYVALMVLWESGTLNVTDLTGRLGLPVNGLTGVLDRLETAELVTRRRGLGDRRVVQVALTAAGRSLEGRAAHAQDQVCCRTGLAPARLAGLRTELQALTTTMSSTE